MEGGPQRANSAQLAARNIKAAKPRRRPGARLGSPSPQPSPALAPGGGGGGGLFGGSVQATGTFDFAAPGSGLSFPSPSFGTNNNPFAMNSLSSPDISENESDPRADTTGEEAARAKRPFRGFGVPDDQPSNSLFQAHVQSTTPFGMLQTQEKSSSFPPFPTTTATPQQSGFGFNTSAAPVTPSANNFSFGQTSSQSNNIFGATNNQAQPAASLFNFGPPAPRSAQIGQPKPPSSPFTFGQSAAQPAEPEQPQSANTLFNFGQPASQPKQPAQPDQPKTLFNFGSPAVPAQDKTASTPVFSFGQTTQSPKINLGTSQSSEAPASNLFGQTKSAPAPAPSNMFGSLGQNAATSSNLFSNLNAPTSSSSNLFGSRNETSAGTSSEEYRQQRQEASNSVSTLFAEEKPQSSSAFNRFGNQQQPDISSSGLFGNRNQETLPSNNTFGIDDKPICSPQDLFGHLNKAVEPSTSTTNIFAKLNGTPLSNTNIEGVPFAESTSSVAGPIAPTNIFASASPLTSLAAQTAVSNSAAKPSFSSEPGQLSLPSGDISASPSRPLGPSSANQAPPSSRSSSTGQPKQDARQPIGAASKSAANTPLRTSTPIRVHLLKVLRTFESSDLAELAESLPEMADAGNYPDEKISPLVPVDYDDEKRHNFYMSFRLNLLNKAMAKYFEAADPRTEPFQGLVFYFRIREIIITRCPPPFRPRGVHRKLPKENQENQDPNDPSRWMRLPAPLQAQSTGRSPASPTKSPPKKNSVQAPLDGKAPTLTSASAASRNLASSTTPISGPPPQGKRKAENQLTKDDYERDEGREPRPLKTPRSNGASGGSNTSNIFKNILDTPDKSASAKAITEKKRIGLPQQPTEETPRFNPFGNLPVPGTTAPKSTPSTNASKSAVSASTPAPVPASSQSTTTSLFTLKPQSSASSIFQPPAPSSQSKSNGTTSGASTAIKPPTFSAGPMNFLAQFGQQASKCKEDSEKKLMEETKAEDMDSDEDESEWEAKYREKRKAELKKVEDIAKNKQATFQPGKGFTFGQTVKPSEDASSNDNNSGSSGEEKPATSDENNNVGLLQNTNTSKSLFGQSFAPQSKGDSIFSSLNVSRTSTPSGSVLDGYSSLKPASFGANIFAHLSDADSGADSGKGNDGDDESTDEASDTENDANKENTSQEPKKRGIGGILTPAEGITAAAIPGKPAAGFAFGSSVFGGFGGASSASGTSSPGGSLFDRVTKDINGNPVRRVSGEEKENTQPGTTSNFFGTISNPFKASDASADKTWKPDSPIKFGAITPKREDSDSMPTVNVTAPTPTKAASPFSNLFGNVSAAKPTTSLFGASSAVGVGFNFGGPPSAGSSLFPSAAASASTSRATSPGATTDGDSAAEGGDPDAEHHEQIDLTSGGPGEENEETLHEVRTKALKFCARSEGDTSNPWETRGVGPLRVLKHKESGATRILLRADPSGTIVLNKALLSQVNYEATGKTIKLLTAGESGKGLETWILQVKTPEIATSLAEVLEKNKPS